MKPTRSRVHMLTVAAARLEQEYANPTLISDLREAARAEAKRDAEGRAWSKEEEARVERQRTLFVMLPVSSAVDRLKRAMMQRAYDLLWNGHTDGCDAILEFLPSKDAETILSAWDGDSIGKDTEPKSQWYEGVPA